MNNFDLSTINFSHIAHSLGDQEDECLNTSIKELNNNADLNQYYDSFKSLNAQEKMEFSIQQMNLIQQMVEVNENIKQKN